MNTFFTIVTATYNSQQHLQEYLNSVASQNYTNFEHIIIDAYSKDNTKAILKAYKNKTRKYPIKIFQYPPKGISDAFNKGIKHASGKYILFLNSDDFLYNTSSLQRAFKHLKNSHNTNWLQGNSALLVKSRIKHVNTYRFRVLAKPLLKIGISLFNHQNSFVKTTVLRKIGGFNTDLRYSMDYDLWLRLIDNHSPKIVDEYFTVFRVWENNTALNAPTGIFMDHIKALKSYYLNKLKRLNSSVTHFARGPL